ncbi:MAG: flavin reductase family protein [Alphaproteobacteria bacterium]
MDEDKKKSTLRMIPYGLYVMTAKDGDDHVGAGKVNWVTQTSFGSPLVAIGVKIDSGLYAIAKAAGSFALNMLDKGQQGLAFGFFKPAESR